MDEEPDQESMIGSALPNGHCSREGASSESDSTPLTLRRKSDCDPDAVPHLGCEVKDLFKKQPVCGLFLVAPPTVGRSHVRVLIKLIKLSQLKRCLAVEEPPAQEVPPPAFPPVRSAICCISSTGSLLH